MKTVLLLAFCLSFFLYADDINLTVSDANCSQVELLEKHIKVLESELAKFKQVEPTVSKAHLSKVDVQSIKKLNDKKVRAEKFILLKETPTTLPTYYKANTKSVEEVLYSLKNNGFTVLSKEEIFDNKIVISFTNEALKNTNSFLSVLHLLVNDKEEIRVQNPSYFAAAFLQEKYHYGDFNTTLQALDKVLGGMYAAKEKNKLANLADYHFMFGMPSFEDTVLVGKGEMIFDKLQDQNQSQHISYSLDLPNGDILVGHKLISKTYAYLESINSENNALVFPYEVMIHQKKAIMLAPKYYLALSLPLLSMTDFLKIVSAPDEIIKEIKKVYK